MSDQLRESVSALIDGEANELELKRLLSAKDDEKSAVEEAWAGYHLVQDVMREGDGSIAFRHLDISVQVSEAVREQPVGRRSRWLQPVAGFAVAASVTAAVVMLGVQPNSSVMPGSPDWSNTVADTHANTQVESPLPSSRVYPLPLQGTMTSQGGMQAAASVSQSYSPVVVPSNSAGLPSQGSQTPGSENLAASDVQQRFDRYFLRHTERAALNNGQGMMSYARVVNYELEEKPSR